jgi:hypothetical protein
MDRRRKPRLTIALPVRVWGVDANALPFMQLATLRNMSDKGILLSGLSRPVRTGAVVEVQYNDVTAEFRVTWAVAGEIGLLKLSSASILWEGFLDRANGIAANG